MTQSGERCLQAGVYESACDDATRVALMAGARFPKCRTHGKVAWALLEGQPASAPQGNTVTRGRTGVDPEWRTESGERCRNTGVYRSLCDDEIRIAVMKGSRFPSCGNHGDVPWVLVKARRF